MIAYNFNWDVIWRNWDAFLGALALGLGLAIVSLADGHDRRPGLAYARLSQHWWLAKPAWVYVEFIRNTPLLLLIFFVYFGLPKLGIYNLDKIQSFILTLSAYAGGLYVRGVQVRPRVHAARLRRGCQGDRPDARGSGSATSSCR